jgi:hypothetical protein
VMLAATRYRTGEVMSASFYCAAKSPGIGRYRI